MTGSRINKIAEGCGKLLTYCYEASSHRCARARGLISAMNQREIIDLTELLERIDRLLKEYVIASTPERLAFLEAEITAAKEKLQRIAASLVN